MLNSNLDYLNQKPLSAEAIFYTISDVQKMTHWSEATVQKMFNDPHFPAADFGRNKIVEAHALISYFSERRSKDKEPHWR